MSKKIFKEKQRFSGWDVIALLAFFGTKKHKIKREDVEGCEILSSNGPTRTSGWDVNFDHEKRFSLNGKSGLHLKTKDGENVVIGARNLTGLKQAVNQVMG